MASIRRKGAYRWEARVNRNSVSQSRTFDTRSDAERWAAKTEQLVRQHRHGIAMEAETLTLDQALKNYADEVSPNKKDGGYIEKLMIERIRRDYPDLCKLPLPQVRLSTLKDWKEHMLTQTGPATFNRHRSLLRRLFVVAASEWDYESLENPVAKLSRAKEPLGRDRRVSDDDVEKLVATAEQMIVAGKRICEMPAIIRLALATGMRAGEIRTLTWPMVDLTNHFIRIAAIHAKNSKARLVPLFPEAEEVLRALQQSTRCVFPGANRDKRAISKDFIEIKKQLGIADMVFHDLRHEFTSRKVEDGWGLLKVQVLTGHSNATMVNRYAHLDTTTLVAEIRQMPAGPLAAARQNLTAGPA